MPDSLQKIIEEMERANNALAPPSLIVRQGWVRRLKAELSRLSALQGEPAALPEIDEEDQQWLHYNPNTSDIVEWVQDYARKAIALHVQPQADEKSIRARAMLDKVNIAEVKPGKEG